MFHKKYIKKISILAPISKKLGAGPAGKSGAGSLGKSSGKSGGSALGKSGASAFGKASSGKEVSGKSSSSAPKLPSGLGSSSSGKSTGFGASSSKSYTSPYISKPKSSKAGFGIIWLPTRKHNKKKDVVYTGHNDAYPKGKYERSPSMYNYLTPSQYEVREEQLAVCVNKIQKLGSFSVISVDNFKS